MKPNDGNPVTGSDFFNRTDELRRFTALLELYQHINLVAPRRCGKTSLMRELLLRFASQGWATLEVDFASCTHSGEFFECLLVKLEVALSKTKDWKDKWKGKLGDFAKRIKEVKFFNIGVGVHNLEAGSFAMMDKELRELLHGLAATGTKGRLLLGTDEIPIFLSRLLVLAGDDETKRQAVKQEISKLLYWLRDLRQDESLPVTWIHCGSIGLENLVVGLGLSHALTGLSHQKIYAFEDQHARGLLQALAKSSDLNLPSAAEDQVLKRLEWFLPYFVQLHLIKLNEPKSYARRQQQDYPTVEDVDAAYEQMIDEGKIHFAYWDTRLDEQLSPPRAMQARQILKWVAAASKGMKRDTIIAKLASKQGAAGDPLTAERNVKDLLSLLENDGYLMRNSQELYTFRSPLLRDFWKRHC